MTVADMTGNGLVEALKAQIEKSIEFLYAPGGKEDDRDVPKVYKHMLPQKSKNRQEENEAYPYVLIQYIGEEIEGMANIGSVYIIVGIAADENRQDGIGEVINCLTRIRNDLLQTGYAEKQDYGIGKNGPFKLIRDGVSFTIPQEQFDPKFYGYIKARFMMPTVQINYKGVI